MHAITVGVSCKIFTVNGEQSAERIRFDTCSAETLPLLQSGPSVVPDVFATLLDAGYGLYS